MLEHFAEIECACLVMTRGHLESHSDDVVRFGNVVERRLSDEVDIDELIEENERNLAACWERKLRYRLIDDEYDAGGFMVKNDVTPIGRAIYI